MIEEYQKLTPESIMKRHGKSFFWSRRFLGKQQAQDTATLYAFCRFVDDLVDECPYQEEIFLAIHNDLKNMHSPYPIVNKFIQMTKRLGMSLDPALILIQTLQQDHKNIAIQKKADLIRYCYGVASTVGLMMCGVLGVKDKEALPFAIDLGIGMQLTNIARDVKEDAMKGRIYLPQEFFPHTVDINAILQPNAEFQKRICEAILRILEMADTYYLSAKNGMHYLPSNARLAIMVSSTLYQAKGFKIVKNPLYYLQNRANVEFLGKCSLTIKTILNFMWNDHYSTKKYNHEIVLHQHLKNLPGVNQINAQNS